MTRSRLAALWSRLKDEPAFRVATVYAGGAWFLLQAADTLGAGPALVRDLALVLAAGFALVVPGVWWLGRSQAAAPATQGSTDAAQEAKAATRAPGRRRRWGITVVALFAIAGGLWVFRSRLMARPIPPAAERIAVLPFHATGSAEVGDFGVGMVDLLTAALNDVGGIRTVPGRTVLARLKESPGGEDLPLEAALDIGRKLGAGSVLMGSLTGFGSTVRLRAELREVGADGGDGDLLATAEVQGARGRMLDLTDQLAVGLLRDLWRSHAPVPTVHVAALTTSSPVALRAYLRGEQELRALRFDSAVADFRAALDSDSLFAIAWLRLAEASGWGVGREDNYTRRHYLTRAAELSDRVGQRERSLIRAVNLRLRGDFAAFDSLESYTQRYPDDPTGWYELGDARFHAGVLGLFSDAEIVAPFMESARLDPAFGLGLHHVLDMDLLEGDRAGFEAAFTPFARVAAPEVVRQFRVAAAVRWANADSLLPVSIAALRELHPVRDRLASLYVVQALGARARLDPAVDPAVFPAALDSLRRLYASDPQSQVTATYLRMISLAALGRLDSAFAEVDDLVALSPSWLPDGPPRVQRAIMRMNLSPPTDRLREDLPVLEENQDADPSIPFRLHLHYLRAGDRARAARFPDTVPTALVEGPPNTRAVDPDALRRGIHAWAVIVAGDTTRGLALFDHSLEQIGWMDAVTHGAPLDAYAEILSRVPERRSQAIRMLRWMIADDPGGTGGEYLALARALEAEGDRDGARAAYGHVLRFWEGADDYRRAEYEEARHALVRLAAEPP